MNGTRSLGACLCCIWLAVLLTAGPALSKSLYVIKSINASPTPIQTYDIQGAPNYLVFQAETNVPDLAGGAVGIAIDPDSEVLFITYEGSDTIQLLNARNMSNLGTVQAPGAYDLAGIVVDMGKGLLYTVDRNSAHLYVYQWNPAGPALTLMTGFPIDLPSAVGLYGIALDEVNGLLYVADGDASPNGIVRVYNTNTWASQRSFAVVHRPISIAVDPWRGYVYTGAAWWDGTSVLSRYTLSTDTESTTTLVEPDTGVIGVDVDLLTGWIYCTTGYDNDSIRVFDAGMNPLKTIALEGDPTGLVVPRGEVSYNPLNFTKIGDTTAQRGDSITYDICCDNLANEIDLTGVVVTDSLDPSVSFVAATGGGTYNDVDHTVTWDIGSLAAGAARSCVQVLVRLECDACTVVSFATITSNELPPTTQNVATTTDITGLHPLVRGGDSCCFIAAARKGGGAAETGRLPHTILGAVLLLGAVSRLRRRLGRDSTNTHLLRLLVMLGVLLAAIGEAGAVDGHLYNPGVNGQQFVIIQPASTLAAGSGDAALVYDYAMIPVETTTGHDLADYQSVVIALAGYGISDVLQISVAVPYLISQDGTEIDMSTDLVSSHVGDITVSARYSFRQASDQNAGFALAPFVIINTGSEDDWFGRDSLAGGITVIVDKRWSNNLALALNLGLEFQDEMSLNDEQQIGHVLHYGLGLSRDFNDQFVVIGEIYGNTPLSDSFDKYLSPLEIDLALGYRINPQTLLTMGAGKEIHGGIGAPVWRAMAGIHLGW